MSRKYPTLAARLLANSVLDPETGCRIWTGKTSRRRGGALDGRITLRINGRHVSRRAHRVSYEVHNGPIPDGYDVDHCCVNSLCIEPTHLDAVTPIVNQQRRAARALAKAPWMEVRV